MSKENAIKFLEFLGKHPEVVQEGKKYDDGKTDMYVIASKVAKDKGYECTAKEIKEAMEMVKKDSSEMSEDNLENVAGGWSSAEEMYEEGKKEGGLKGTLKSGAASVYNFFRYGKLL